MNKAKATNMVKKIALLSILLFLFIPASAENNWYKVYFTSPPQTKGEELPHTVLVKLIDLSEKSVSAALFDLELPSMIKALANAAKRGVEVKLVTDDEYTDKKIISYLKNRGVNVVTDNKSSLMHNKFVIIDNKYLWTGSFNVTRNGSFKNNNNAILISSPKLASLYEYEFREMFEYSIFSNSKEQKEFSIPKNHYHVQIGSTHINAYFSPDNRVEKIISKRILKAKKSIVFMAFSFTSDEIGDAVLAAHNKGLKVAGIFEKRGVKSKYSEYRRLKEAGVSVMYDSNPHNMHHKVIIIDEETVITGSYNFSKNASKRNDENILIIKDKKIAELYTEEFVRLYK